jgi:hypothetical protein
MMQREIRGGKQSPSAALLPCCVWLGSRESAFKQLQADELGLLGDRRTAGSVLSVRKIEQRDWASKHKWGLCMPESCLLARMTERDEANQPAIDKHKRAHLL